MKVTERYNIWQKIFFVHSYYEDRRIPIRLLPDKPTQQILDKYELVFRKAERNTWVILSAIHRKDITEINALGFHIQPTDPVFYYVSEKILAAIDTCIEVPSIPKSWFTLRLPTSLKEHSITIPTRSYYWEFLLFLPAIQDYEALSIYEKANRICFGKAEKLEWPEYPQVISIRSTEPISVQQGSPYTIRLKEHQQGRERILCDHLSPPLPDRLSPTGKRNTITTYFYL
ncbi:MAG: hypothetical protein LUD02_04335 [Tannerellaceae bacterium]|nr:hypothetical protein [Tannerellaceae bacterium]MCD8263474.1 hypothetical protein [Tannerellaceae bacterium]